MSRDLKLRKNYSPLKTYQPFFTGGKVQISDDEEYMFCVCDSTVAVVKTETLSIIHTLQEEEDSVSSFAVSNEILVIGWRNSQLLRQYDWKNGICTRQWKGHTATIIAMEFDVSSTLLATGSSDGIIKIWDCVRQYCTHNFKDLVGVVSLVRFHPTELILFSSSSDNLIRIWDLNTSRCIMILDGHVSHVTSLVFTNDGKNLISGGRDKVINIWSWSDGELIKTLPVFESIEGVVILPSNINTLLGIPKHSVAIATAGDKGIITIWNLTSGSQIRTFESLRYSQTNDGSSLQVYTDLFLSLHHLVGVTSDHDIIIYDINTFRKIKHCVGCLDEVLDIKCIDDHVAIATNSEQIKVFNRSHGNCSVLLGHSDIVLTLDISTDGSMLVSGSKDNNIIIWRMFNNEYYCCGIGHGHTMSVGAVSCARVMPPRFVVSGSIDNTIKIWNIDSVHQVNKEVNLSVKCTQIAHLKDINSIHISPNDKLIVTGSQDKTAKLWRVSDCSLVGILKGHRRGVWSVQFSPIDQCILTSSSDNTVKLWSVSDLCCLKTFEGHNTSVLKAIFITRGTQIVSADNNGIMKIWNIKSQECINTIDKHNDRIWALSSSIDGEYIFSGGADSLVFEWKDVTEEIEANKHTLKEDEIIREQELLNLLHDKDYVRAVGVALSLEQPLRVLTILRDLLDVGDIDGEFKYTIISLREDQLGLLVGYLNKWNTNSKYCRVAQSVLNILLKTIPPNQLIEIDGMKDILRGLIPYTERHFQRMSRLKQLASFVEYTWQCMKLPDDIVSEENVTCSEYQTSSVNVGGTSEFQTSLVVTAQADSTTNKLSEEDVMESSEDQKKVHVSRKLVKKRKHLHKIKKCLHNSKIKSH